MPFSRPSLSDLITRIKGDFRGRLSLASPLLRRAMADVFAVVWAGAVHILYGFLEWLSRQLFANTAERPALLSIASMYGITPIPASFATGTATVTGVNGTSIPINTILQLDSDTTYRVTALATIASGTADLALEAVTAGAAANIPAPGGVTLTFQSPISGVSATAVVDSTGITGGFDEEGTEGTRARLILRLQEPPEGGADQDYEAWALAVAGVTRAWVYPVEDGLGTVAVRFVYDAQTPSIFPDAGELTTMQTALDAERPITAQVTAKAPTSLAVAFTIHVVPNTAAVKAAVAAELADMLFREAEPGDGAGRGTIRLSHILTAIGVSEGVTDFALTVPAADVVPTLGQLAQVGVITWV